MVDNNTVMLTKNDRHKLIEKLDLKRDGKLKKSLKSLNAIMLEDSIPYQIKEFETSRIENGKKRKYKVAWRIIKIDYG